MAGVSSEDRLQQYFDGELEGGDAEIVRRELAEDPALQAKLDGLSHLRGLVVAAAEERAGDVDSDALWTAVAERLGEEPGEEDDPMLPATVTGTPRPRLRVVPGVGETKAEGRAEPRRVGNANRFWIGASVVLAAAAALLLFVSRPDGDATGPMATSAPPPGSEVVEVDFGHCTGAVFSVEGQAGEHYAVVWISDEEAIFADEGQEVIQ